MAKCRRPKKDGSACGMNAMKGKDHCYTHRPKEVQMIEESKEDLGERIRKLEKTVEGMAEAQKRFDQQQRGFEERLQVLHGRVDVFQKMLEEDAKVQREWKPLPRERYPAAFVDDPNNQWVMVTPIADGKVTKSGAGISFTVPFKRGIVMGTLTTFADDARNKGLIP